MPGIARVALGRRQPKDRPVPMCTAAAPALLALSTPVFQADAQSVMDVQHLGPSTTLAVINEQLIINEWLDEVRTAFRKRLNGVGGTNWKNDVHAEDLDQVLRTVST